MATPPPVLEQSASNANCKGQSRTCTATFDTPSTEKSLIVLSAVLGGGGQTTFTVPPGFVTLRERAVGYLQVGVWYYEGAPSMSAVAVTAGADRSMQVRVVEYTGAAQTLCLDKVSILTSNSNQCDTGTTSVIAQADEIAFSLFANRHASTTQGGFVGGLVRLFESVSPQYYGYFGWNNDEDRTRWSHHHLICNSVAAFRHYCWLSSYREWIAIIATFRGGSSGPKRMTSLNGAPMITVGGSGNRAQLSAFGAFKSTSVATPMINTNGGSASMLPFVFQFRMNGLLIGQDTRYDVLSHDGLYGYNMRTSDTDQPRGDGAQRGVDLQSVRQILFELEIGGSEAELEQLLGVLYQALIPQRASDWELIWRHPTQSPRMIRCRPIHLPRSVDDTTTQLTSQKVALVAADPRHYSALPHRVRVPVTPAGAAAPTTVAVNNAGDIPAYPIITITGPTSGAAVSRVELVNSNGLVTFDVQLTLAAGSVLIGDMDARVTGAPRSVITLDGASKYGAWQLPRDAFRLDPSPMVLGGDNLLYLRTTPAGAPVTCTLDYRDTWAG